MERNGGAWCPARSISPETYEWLQIDLQTLHRVTAVETQGRFGNAQVSSVTSLLCSRADVRRGA